MTRVTATKPIGAAPSMAMPLGEVSFIETQFPVSKLSKESYAERRSNQGQTITGLGKWWGRKPLVLCRATILGLLLPATQEPQNDRDIFLRLMTMDDDGMLRRKSKNIPAKLLFGRLSPTDRERYFAAGSTEEEAKFKSKLSKEDKDELQRRVFLSLSYDERLEYCDRPEQISGPSPASWAVINAHLGTNATRLSELVAELGNRSFGRVPRLGDSFCGGGSIPFEAARIGCDSVGTDLNPVAAMLTWASINIIGGGEKIAKETQKALREVWDEVDRQITKLGVEHRDKDRETGRKWRADAYLYCAEVTCPECGWTIPLSPTWLVAPTAKCVVQLVPDLKNRRYDFAVVQGASAKQMKLASDEGTFKDAELICPQCREKNPDKAHTPIKAIRGDGRGTFGDAKSRLRPWTNEDVVPRPNDIFGERLYCIRWVDTWTEIDDDGNERTYSERHYRAPDHADLHRDEKVLSYLKERFGEWQKKGFIPSRPIEPGEKTDEPIRTRGWTHWQHLFTPRQLLLNGLFLGTASQKSLPKTSAVAVLLGVGRCADWNSRLCRWGTGAARESIAQTFSNQALNTLYSYASKAQPLLTGSWFPISPAVEVAGKSSVSVSDARMVSQECDLWVTDPPYADAIMYDEISEFFLAWYEEGIRKLFPDWPTDSRRALAVRGNEDGFRGVMVDCYRALARRMPGNGLQVVMFTHQDPSVWADLAMILWAAGLKVSAAWCIQTERDASGTREGNYVQGTVLLVLRKQRSEEIAFLDEVYNEVEAEVRRMVDSMQALDDALDPNFTDTDYYYAAYAAALKVLTGKKIEEIDVGYELARQRAKGEKSRVEDIIDKAKAIACDHLVPKGIEKHLWKQLGAAERFFIKGVEMESHGERREGVYQDLAKSFGVPDYRPLLASTKANETRLKSATEFGRKEMGHGGFGDSLVRHTLFAAFKAAETESTRDSLTWLKTEVKDYAASRGRLIDLLEFIASLGNNASMTHWHRDAYAAGLVAGALRNREDNV